MNQPKSPKKILIIDSETLSAAEHKTFLEKQGMSVVTAPDYTSGLYLFNQNVIEVALVSLELEGMSGLTIVQKFRANENILKKFAGIILMSKSRERDATDMNACKELGGIEIVAKPFKTVTILGHLQKTFAKRNLDIAVAEFKEKVLNYHREKQDFDKAIEAVKKKMPELGSKGPELLLNVYEESGKFEEALKFTDGMMARPEFKADIRLTNTKGRLLMKLGKFAEAKEFFEVADKMAPHNLERISQMAKMYLELKEPNKSVSKYKELIEMTPENKDVKFDMFAQMQEHGFEAEAVQFCQETTGPAEVVKHYNNKGVILAKSNDQTGALKSYEDALKFYPQFSENYRIHYNLALGLLKSTQADRVPKAIAALEKALQLSPDYDKAKDLLQRLKQGKDSNAA